MAYTPPSGAAFGNAPIIQDPRRGLVKNWSFSSLSNFEKCAYQIFLARVKKLPQESGPAAERGTQIHQLAEDFVNGLIPDLPKELIKMASDFDWLRKEYVAGKVLIEDEWAFNTDWDNEDWKSSNAWTRMKLDALIFEDEHSCKIVDHKTGKKFGNEFKHTQQGQLYAIGTFFRYPNLQFAKVEFWYLDHGQKLEKSYSREQAMRFLNGWNKRATRMTSCSEFIPNPSKPNCKFCPYGNLNGSGACEWSQ